jgi:hypothetical protein
MLFIFVCCLILEYPSFSSLSTGTWEDAGNPNCDLFLSAAREGSGAKLNPKASVSRAKWRSFFTAF